MDRNRYAFVSGHDCDGPYVELRDCGSDAVLLAAYAGCGAPLDFRVYAPDTPPDVQAWFCREALRQRGTPDAEPGAAADPAS